MWGERLEVLLIALNWWEEPHIRKKHRTHFFVFYIIFRALAVRVVLLKRPGVRPGAFGCRFQVSDAVNELECALRAFR